MPGPPQIGNGCDVDGSIDIINECNFLKLVWTAGNDNGRIELISKKNISFQKTNEEDFIIKNNEDTIYLKYSEINQEQPKGHNNITELFDILLMWLCLDSKVNPADTRTDSFGRTRVSHCINLLHSYFRYKINKILFNTKINGLATVLQSINPTPAAYLKTTTTGIVGINNDKAILQSKIYLPFQSDSSMYIVIGATIRTTKTANFNTARVGYFDDAFDKDVAADIGGSGVFFELGPDGTAYACIRKFISGAQIDTKVPQQDWVFDTMDGSGASKDNIDFTKPQLYCFEIEMSSSRIRLGFNINGGIVWAHQFVNYNLIDQSQLFNYSLPIRAELLNFSGSDNIQQAAEMHIFSVSGEACGNVNASDHNMQSNPYIFALNTSEVGTINLNGSGDHISAITIRLKYDNCRGIIWPRQISLDNENGSAILWRLILNPTYDGPLVYFDNGERSIVEYSLTQRNLTFNANTHILATGYVSSQYSQQIPAIIKSFGISSTIEGNIRDELSLSIEYVRGQSKVRGILCWTETY